MSEISLNVDSKAFKKILGRMDVLSLPKGRRFKILRQLGQAIRKQARDNIKQQRTVDGNKMPPRKQGKKKMLRKLGNGLTTETGDDSVTVKYASAKLGKIAYRQQHGIDESMTASKMQKIHGSPDYKKPATRAQAVALIRAGFKRYAGKTKSGSTRGKKPAARWITEKLKMGYAGWMLRTLRGDTKKRSWSIKLPARPFLGVTEKEAIKMLQRIMAEQTNKKTSR